MPESPKARPAADRNLLFGILALQMDFISRDTLISAMNAWVLAKSKSIGKILQEQGALASDTFALLEALVQKHLALHGNDIEKSLAAVAPAGAIQEDLKTIQDQDVQASLAQFPPAARPEIDPHATRGVSIGAPSSSGLRFRILRPHARGGLGQVSVALDEELHREVALKEIHGHHADDVESRARFLLEAEITGGLEHPGIVPVYGLGQYADGRPFYAMRFIRGDNLKDAIERFHKAERPGRDPGERTLELRHLLGRFIDVCNAIGYAHSRGVLHRDLKPGNIMLGNYGETLVVDWGLAKPVDKVEGVTPSNEGPVRPSSLAEAMPTLTGSAMGTPQYMSPEQAMGRLDRLGPASDVYSLGATLYCLLTGQSPFSDRDVETVLSKVERGDFPRPRDLNRQAPAALEAICLKAMALNPADRYVSPRALADDIEHWLADERVSAWTEPWTVRTLRWIRRHRTFVAGSAAAVAVAAICFATATLLLTAANRRERAARASAEANYQLAREAVDRYHTEVSESVLLNEPGLQPLRKKLLEAAREFYEKFVQERSQDAGVQGELGKALFRLAQITGEIDTEAKAIDLHQQALRIFAKLAGDNPSSEELQRDLASCYHQLGRLYRLTDQPAKSQESYTNALHIWEQLLHDHPDSEPYQAEIARTELGLGNGSRLMGQVPAAQAAYEKALAIREELLKKRPDFPEYRRDLAVALSNLGTVFAATGQSDKAKGLFERAVLLQESLIKEYPNVSLYQKDLARSYYVLGDLLVQVGEPQKAAAALSKAVDVWEQLTQLHPAVSEFQTNLAETSLLLAGSFAAAQRTEKAEEACERALAIRQKLARDHQDTPSYQGDLARCYYQIGNVYRKSRRTDSALDAYRTCLSIQEKLASDFPKTPLYRADLGRSYNNLGILYQEMNQKDDANKSYQKALALWDTLIEQAPQEPEFVQEAAKTCFNLGLLSRSYAKVPDAKRWYSEADRWYAAALARLDKLPAEKRSQASVKRTIRDAHWGRADILTQLEQYAEAIQEWDRAIAVADSPGQLLLRSHRALTRARSGDHSVAVAEADELAKSATKQGEALYVLACVYCVSARVLDKDSKPATDERSVLKEKYLVAAGELLRQAQQAGYFKNQANLARLKENPDFDDLRQREGFEKMLKG
jgi:serine/threonine-protein kinase